ncbi:FAD-binding oxidoreductase [Pendulispora albinea]|uniref:FAD-binding oxidoreductase n=1 Tax=Pendulispora albinea TaxID=2741071 RepID=A0ABZ2M094_9BACT
MAANPKTLRILASHPEGSSARALEIETIDGSPLAPTAGKYIIVNTGVVVGEKAIKRAYSLLPVPGVPHRARLLVKRLGGPGSEVMHAAPVGTELSFSGPWGKLIAPGHDAPVSDGADAPRTLVVATDTGITTALGIALHASTLSTCRVLEVLWLRSEDETFLDVDSVEARIEQAGVRFVHAAVLPASDPNRVHTAWSHVDARVAELGAELVIASGDGAIIHPLRTRWALPEVRIECYFHNPEKKSA